MSLLIRRVVLAACLAAPLAAQARPARIAIVLDQQSPRFQPMVDAFQREIQEFFRPGEVTLLPPLAGDGTSAGVRTVLQRALRDTSVKAVVSLGAIGSHLLARSGAPARPVIAGSIVDASWQRIPQRSGVSGVKNLVYVDESYALGATIAEFRRMVPFAKVALLLDRQLMAAIPEIDSAAAVQVRAIGAEAVFVPADADPEQLLSAIPADVDAVYLTPLPGFSDAAQSRLLAGLNQRRLPTLSYVAEPDIRAGALASYEPPENWRRRARRIAVNLQRILAGEDAGTLPVRLISASRLTLNLATARQIGFAPGRSLLTDAELVGTDSAGPADTLTLGAAMRGALAANLELAAADLEVASGAQNVRLARANLLPQVESRLTETFTRAGTAEASFGQQPEQKLEGGLSVSMPLFAEQAWAGYGSEKRLQRGREARREEVRLDVMLSGATAYLQVLRTQTLADVRRSNLYRTRSNLEVARLREGVGSASRADIYRWQGEVANARRELIHAEAQIRVAMLEVNRLLNRPLDRPSAHQAVTLGDPALLAQDTTVFGWLDHPRRFAELTRFFVAEALRQSPEVTQSEAALAAQERQHAAAGRAFWLPEVSLQGGVSNVMARGGAGSSVPSLPSGTTLPTGPDLTWQFRVQASFPLFTGFGKTAARAQTGLDLDRLKVQRDAVRAGVDQRIRSSLESAAASFAAIALTRDAAEAAGRNYDLVSEAYARGTTSITALIDAQSAQLEAAESAANAVHDFLLDLMKVERAIGSFSAVQPDALRQAFQRRLHALKEQQP